MVAYTCSVSTQDVEGGGTWQVGGQPGLRSAFQVSQGSIKQHCGLLSLVLNHFSKF